MKHGKLTVGIRSDDNPVMPRTSVPSQQKDLVERRPQPRGPSPSTRTGVSFRPRFLAERRTSAWWSVCENNLVDCGCERSRRSTPAADHPQRRVLQRMAASNSLPHRQVVQARGLLCAGDGTSYEEIARRAGVDSDAVRSLAYPRLKGRVELIIECIWGSNQSRPRGQALVPAVNVGCLVLQRHKVPGRRLKSRRTASAR